jgi:hypothetical protein
VLDESYPLDAQQFLGSLAEGAVAFGVNFDPLHRALLDGELHGGKAILTEVR